VPNGTKTDYPPLTAVELESIELFISFLRLLGLPKSVGEIYGLLFTSTRPIPMDEMMGRLKISAGAASQGLRFLRSFGAVKVVYAPGDRRDHYAADLELSRFASNFIREELQPRMDRAIGRLDRMESELTKISSTDERAETDFRIQRLRFWMKKGNTLIPWALRFLQE